MSPQMVTHNHYKSVPLSYKLKEQQLRQVLNQFFSLKYSPKTQFWVIWCPQSSIKKNCKFLILWSDLLGITWYPKKLEPVRGRYLAKTICMGNSKGKKGLERWPWKKAWKVQLCLHNYLNCIFVYIFLINTMRRLVSRNAGLSSW